MKKEIYYIYRLIINKKESKIYIIQNPIDKFKKDILDMLIDRSLGIEMSFEFNDSVDVVDLLC